MQNWMVLFQREREREREREIERDREREREGILREIVRFAEIFPPEIV